MEFKNFLYDINNRLLNIISRQLSVKEEKLAKKLYNQRYTADDAVSILLTKI